MRKTSLVFALVGSLLMGACSFKDSPIVAKNKDLNNKLKILINDDINYTALPKGNEDELIREFLTNSPAFAQQNRQSAVRENITKLPNTMPLFRQPLFAQMVIFPFVSDDGLYHSYSESWLKIKDGEFVLSDPRSGEEAKEKIFDFNVINGE
ncbi:hypothetical protein DMB95_06870 [Campylobacter sp. MIT 12-8780]|uniref:hypothetical protein n=1 Tax=Campylobacter sp. MIT 12-8780 TaxID=2202200 RepID=UPI00115DD4CE|nr:hypothetical protein [Campylobacter sp. MIT 12-8780]TQR40848.1 hypothetical protein DMB95_06870 [Campylobacter sp. MIT 12-8780]